VRRAAVRAYTSRKMLAFLAAISMVAAVHVETARHVVAYTHPDASVHKSNGWLVDRKQTIAPDYQHTFYVFLNHDQDQYSVSLVLSFSCESDDCSQAFSKLFDEVTDPGSPKYGQYPSRKSIEHMLTPRRRHDLVHKWISSGIPVRRIESHGDAFKVTASAVEIQLLFNTTLRYFTSAHTGRRLVRAHGELSIPATLRSEIDIVAGLTELFSDRAKVQFGAPTHDTKQARKRNLQDRCANCTLIDPAALRFYYNISDSLVCSRKCVRVCSCQLTLLVQL
jgi:hypothetical protein